MFILGTSNGQGSSFQTFGTERMQPQSTNFVHTCTTAVTACGPKNYDGMRRVLKIQFLVKKFTPITWCAIKWKRKMVFPWHFIQQLAHGVMWTVETRLTSIPSVPATEHLLFMQCLQFLLTDFFPARRTASAVFAVKRCLPVCLSHAGIVSERLNLS